MSLLPEFCFVDEEVFSDKDRPCFVSHGSEKQDPDNRDSELGILFTSFLLILSIAGVLFSLLSYTKYIHLKRF